LEKSNLTIADLQSHVDSWIKEIGVRYFSPLTNLAILMEEVGELARLMARKYGDQSFKEGESEENIKRELGDILFVVSCLANQMDVSLEEAVKLTLEKNTRRDKDRHKQNPKLQS